MDLGRAHSHNTSDTCISPNMYTVLTCWAILVACHTYHLIFVLLRYGSSQSQTYCLCRVMNLALNATRAVRWKLRGCPLAHGRLMLANETDNIEKCPTNAPLGVEGWGGGTGWGKGGCKNWLLYEWQIRIVLEGRIIDTWSNVPEEATGEFHAQEHG